TRASGHRSASPRGMKCSSVSTRARRSSWTARRSKSSASPTSWPRSSSDSLSCVLCFVFRSYLVCCDQSSRLMRPTAYERRNTRQNPEPTTVPKQLLFSDAARRKMFEGVDTLAKAVGTTLGPTGHNVIVSKSFGGPKVTKDGVTVAKEIELPDPFENMGAK